MNSTLARLEEGKLYYSISEVCRMTGLEPHVLRYWETEFAQMRPKKNRAGNRAYRMKEIQYIQYIRQLLHEEKYTLQGAKKRLSEVTPEEVAGQTTLLRVPPAPKKAEKEVVSGAAESLSPGISEAQRAELLAIRDGLREVLELLGK
ncbi:MAG: putative transcriptional regulator [Fibrobacteria bacterium]|nr:putative transcriptional regulator [Fibrobacteria bacterium]